MLHRPNSQEFRIENQGQPGDVVRRPQPETPLVAAALGILGSIMGILQIALAVQASVAALRMMGIVTEGA